MTTIHTMTTCGLIIECTAARGVWGLHYVSTSIKNEYKHPGIIEEASLGARAREVVSKIDVETMIVGNNLLCMHEATLLAHTGLERWLDITVLTLYMTGP